MKIPHCREITLELLPTKLKLKAFIAIPEKAEKIIVFAHGSGSGRHSPRNQFVANELVNKNLAILLLDLLTQEEDTIDEMTRELRFDIPLLAERLISTAEWLRLHHETHHLRIGYFGASTGSAAALIAAARDHKIFAVVSRGGRPDLAAKELSKVRAPTLLIVGGDDVEVIELNQQAFELLQCEKKLRIVPGATHLFEEPGTLEQVADLAADWFAKH